MKCWERINCDSSVTKLARVVGCGRTQHNLLGLFSILRIDRHFNSPYAVFNPRQIPDYIAMSSSFIGKSLVSNTVLSDVVNGTKVDSLSTANNLDIYKFALGGASSVNVAVKGFSKNVNLALVQDKNGNDAIEVGEILRESSNADLMTEFVNGSRLESGSYYLAISLGGGIYFSRSESCFDGV
jgi:hypothetical protein